MITEFIKSIYGPDFLLIYAVFSAIIIFVTYRIAKNDGTQNLPVPEPTKYTPFILSLLTHGVKGSVSLALFSLWQKKRIEIDNTAGGAIKITDNSKPLVGDDELETFVLKQAHIGRTYSEFFKKTLFPEAQTLMNPYLAKLVELKLLRSSEEVERLKWLALRAGIVLLMFSGIKLYLGIVRDKPVAFLVMLMILSIIILYSVINPTASKPTLLGIKFIKASNARFEYMKKAPDESIMADNSLLYGVALFGIGAFAATSAGSAFADPAEWERKYNASGSGCSSDSSSSSDSGSGCSSSSSDGGGSGCGG